MDGLESVLGGTNLGLDRNLESLVAGWVSAKQIPRVALLAREADASGIVRFRSECCLSSFLSMITGQRSTLFVEIQGPVCVDGLVLQSSWCRFGNVNTRIQSPMKSTIKC
jgi:hypothetical protein